ncbi:tetratricopeptide repeat protein [Xanthomonas graminis]|uniref:tetratricopeptide repeat protein n=1 Tax=Xanthomonas graminis TaxID=3390026 RepID=UPI001F27D1B7|nr:hypothetical protein [Xanthomonas translucens]UKE66973.1 hypothetical protein KM547_06950 [Xanthomonas translucens pv. phlei]
MKKIILSSAGIAFAIAILAIYWKSNDSEPKQHHKSQNVSGEPSPMQKTLASSNNSTPHAQNSLSISSENIEKLAGLKVQRLTGKAFIIEDFGVAPSGNAVDVIRKLEAPARNGDSRASYELYLKIKECMELVKGRPAPASAGSSSSFDDCKDLSADYYTSAAYWLQLAANQGNIGAQLLYGSDPGAVLGDPSNMLRDPNNVKKYKENALAYWNAAANSGSVDALLRLASAYRNGILANQNLSTSYAYYEAVRAVSPELTPKRTMEEIAQGLDANEMTVSTQKGRGIYDKCCRP